LNCILKEGKGSDWLLKFGNGNIVFMEVASVFLEQYPWWFPSMLPHFSHYKPLTFPIALSFHVQ
jgi:hypothetical protein